MSVLGRRDVADPAAERLAASENRRVDAVAVVYAALARSRGCACPCRDALLDVLNALDSKELS